MSQRLCWVCVVAIVFLCVAVVGEQLRDALTPGFEVVPVTSPPIAEKSFYHEEIINNDQNLPFVHVGSVVEFPGGVLGALWYGGPYEYCHDNSIYFCTEQNGVWQKPHAIMTPEKAEQDLGRPIRCLGNPLFLPNNDGSLRLLFVTIAMGRWSGAQLNTCLSRDGGLTWSRAERLTLSPLCNFSELVRNRPMPLLNGAGTAWCIPLYQELIGKFPELLWLKERAGQVVYSKSRIAGGCATLQPSLIPLDDKQAVVLLRDWTHNKKIFVSHTGNAGLSWTNPVPTNLPNPDAGISGLRLSDGRLIVAYNDSTMARENFSLAISADNGASWKKLYRIESDPDAFSSYPFMLRTKDGLLHVVFTHDGDDIKMASFNETWVKEQEARNLQP